MASCPSRRQHRRLATPTPSRSRLAIHINFEPAPPLLRRILLRARLPLLRLPRLPTAARAPPLRSASPSRLQHTWSRLRHGIRPCCRPHLVRFPCFH
ncbi:hypothetical protein ZWY2020_034582 [Hordeum vulgare]|nr:hypothetical protein ZWY2020_034582 [Hordeum vulgare]